MMIENYGVVFGCARFLVAPTEWHLRFSGRALSCGTSTNLRTDTQLFLPYTRAPTYSRSANAWLASPLNVGAFMNVSSIALVLSIARFITLQRRSSMGCAARDTEVVKPLNDVREYRRVVLPNQLQVLLISDPDTDKAAAAMDVNVGSHSNPEGLEGLAHFLEHMLFYSNEKYPEEGTYLKFLAEHGGHSNAYTATEHTNFHFDVNVDYLEEALDRFAQFFTCPLLSADATSREIKAVDAENSKNYSSDSRRLSQLQKLLSSKDHPYYTFGTGNLDTLEIGPKSRGVDIQTELIKFYNMHYSSNLMCLVIYGKETLDDLQKLAQDKFRGVRNIEREAPRFFGQPCLKEHLQILVKAVPVRERHMLELMWPVTPSVRNYKKGASSYLSHLLGHEADGSLFALLKASGWANSLSAGETDSSFEYAFFTLRIELTDAGQEHMQDVVSLTFQYIRILQRQGVAKWIYEEIRAVRATTFHFKDKTSPIDYVTSLAGNMHIYPLEDWLSGSSLLAEFDKEAIAIVIQQLKAQHVRIFWSSKQFAGKTTDLEPWYGTSYILEHIDDQLVKKWESAVFDPRLHLPSPNVFIPTDFSLRNLDAKVQHPVLIRNTSMSKLWYKPDTKFGMPKAYIQLQFNCPESNYSPEASVLTDIFTKLVEDNFNDFAYYAEVAGMTYSVHRITDGFKVMVAGYNHKLRVLMDKTIDQIVSFQVKKDRFAVVKEKVIKDLVNMRFQQPYEQADYNFYQLIQLTTWHMNEYLEVLPSLQANTLTSFLPRILSRVHVEAYVAGNITLEEAESLVNHIEVALAAGPLLKAKPVFASQQRDRRIVRLEPGCDWYYPTAGLNPDDENSALINYHQVGQDDTTQNVLLELFCLAAKQQFFNQLRTVEQLGYIVSLRKKSTESVRGIFIIVQSSVKDPKWLDRRVESFLNLFKETLQKTTDEEFKRQVSTLTEMKLEKHKNLWEECHFYWREINDGTLNFDRVDIEVSALKKLEKQDLLRFFEQTILSSGQLRRKLSIQVYGKQHAQELRAAKGETEQVNCNVANVGVTATANGWCYHSMEDQVGAALYYGKQKGLQTWNPHPIRIDSIQTFKHSQALYGS